jgi:DNA-binding response OmpR family regulator
MSGRGTGSLGQKKTVLVVDDDRMFLVSAKAALSDDYSVVLLDSGDDALKKLKDGLRPDVILLDIDMPGLNGYLTLEGIKALPEAGDVPVIFLTGLDAAEEQVMGLSSGVVDYITKPFEKRVLLARLKLRIAAEKEKRWLNSARQSGTLVELDEEKLENQPLLTDTEKKIVRLLVTGHSYQEIAEALGYAVSYVRKRSVGIFDKTGTDNKSQLKKAFVRNYGGDSSSD